MKIFFASLTDLSIEVDCWVPTKDQGLILLEALRDRYLNHNVVMRARMQRFHNHEVRHIGLAIDAVGFIERVKEMGDEALQD